MPIYTVKQTFAENEKLIFNDKTHKIFYNVKAFEKIANDVETKAFWNIFANINQLQNLRSHLKLLFTETETIKTGGKII